MKEIKTKFLVILFGVWVFASGALALADDRGDHRDDDRGEVKVNVEHKGAVDRHDRHYYRNGRWYKHGWFGFEIAVPVLPTGVYVDTLPPAYTPVVVQGTTYYYGDNTYFKPLPEGGYTVVSVSP